MGTGVPLFALTFCHCAMLTGKKLRQIHVALRCSFGQMWAHGHRTANRHQK